MSEVRDIAIAYPGVLFQGNSGHRTRRKKLVLT